jgi:hypothetical protein
LELKPDWATIRRELLEMAAEDGRVRAELAADGSLFQGYHPRMRAVHDRHAARLAPILATHGWPGERPVGEDGAGRHGAVARSRCASRCPVGAKRRRWSW